MINCVAIDFGHCPLATWCQFTLSSLGQSAPAGAASSPLLLEDRLTSRWYRDTLALHSAQKRTCSSASRTMSGESPGKSYPASEDEGTRQSSSRLSICLSSGRPKF